MTASTKRTQVANSRGWYNPHWHHDHEPETRAALDLIFSGHFNRTEPGIFDPLREVLLTRGDYYMHLADLKSYLEADQRLVELYADPDGWARKAILNVAGSSKLLAWANAIWGQPEKHQASDRRALLRCLFDLGLRRAEVLNLDLEDLDREAGTVAVLEKGRTSKMKLTLPTETKKALDAWIDVRGVAPGPRFCSMNRTHAGKGRLTAIGLYGMVRELGRRLGFKVWPHGLRHAAITEALDLTGGNVRAVQRFSRHQDVRVLERYDDNRRDLGGEVAKQVAASVPGHTQVL